MKGPYEVIVEYSINSPERRIKTECFDTQREAEAFIARVKKSRNRKVLNTNFKLGSVEFQRPNPSDTTNFNGEILMLKDLPTQVMRARFGIGHFPGDIRTRERLIGTWEFSPEDCLEADNYRGGTSCGDDIACNGCGLDFT